MDLGDGQAKVTGRGALSSMGRAAGGFVLAMVVLLTMALSLTPPARAHEMNPAIADVTLSERGVEVVVTVSAEAWLAGVNLTAVTDTNDSAQAGQYDALRALSPIDLEARIRDAWPRLAKGIEIMAGEARLDPALSAVSVAEATSPDLARSSRLTLSAPLPADDSAVTVGWIASYGPLILRQQGQALADGEEAYSAFLDGGAVSAPMPRSGNTEVSALTSFLNYVVTGFLHILPMGLDHILFVLGLFFFSLHIRPLLYQVTAFTAAHTLTLALATLGLVTVPSSIVEPLIAASIAYVAIENIFHRKMTGWRVAVVFGFGLLHGLGFASVLGDFGLSPGHFIASLIAFNIGVELGQLAIITAAFLAVGLWFGKKPWYRARIATPASAAIAIMGIWWVVERTIL